MKNLQEEAEEYKLEKIHSNPFITHSQPKETMAFMNGFDAGVNSKWVQQEKILDQIALLKRVAPIGELSTEDYAIQLLNNLTKEAQELKKQLEP